MNQKGPKVAKEEMSIQKAIELSKQLENGGVTLSDDTAFPGIKK